MNAVNAIIKAEDSDLKKALTAAYASLLQTSAWKDLIEYAREEQKKSMERVDSKAASELNIGTVCEERGIRKGIFKIIQYAEQRAEGI